MRDTTLVTLPTNRLTVCPKNGVPPFTPELPEPCQFGKDAVSRDFFLHKCKIDDAENHPCCNKDDERVNPYNTTTVVNGERAAYKAPSFAPKISRTRSVLLYEVASKFLK